MKIRIFSTIIVILLLTVVLMKGGMFGLGYTKEGSLSNSYNKIRVDEVRSLIAKGENIVLLDVREPHEYEETRIEGAILIPLGKLQNNLEGLNTEDKIIVICRSGNRSAKASQLLIDNDFKDVYNMVGGMLEWDK